jgi:hypothetical protein
MEEKLRMDELGQAAVLVAELEWEKVIRDPEDEDDIIRFHNTSGADWATNDGYQEDTDFWCGVFVAHCYSMAGSYLAELESVSYRADLDVELDKEIGSMMFPSTTRLAGRGPVSWEGLRDGEGLPKPDIVDPKEVRPGDIPVVSTGRTNRVWGDHVTIARGESEKGRIPTYEGNAFGVLGNGSSGEGVIQGERRFEDVAVVYRLLPEHFVGSAAELLQEVE